MFSLMARLFRHPRQIQIIKRDPCRLTLEEWRSSPELVLQAQKYLNDPGFRIMLDVLDMENPIGISNFAHIPIEERAIMQARCEGYRMAISTLESMGKPTTRTERVVATFEDEAEEEKGNPNE